MNAVPESLLPDVDPTEGLPPVLDEPQLCRLLGMSPRSLYRAMRRPGWLFPPLPGMGAKKRWSRDQVLRTIATARGVTPRRHTFGGR